MNISKNEWIKSETVRLFLLGFSQDKISKELNISIGSVNGILSEALSQDKTLELQRHIAILVNKKGTTIKQVAANLRWKNAIKLRGLDDKKIEKLLDLMDAIFNKNDFPPAKTAELLVSSVQYMLRNQLDPQRLEEEIRISKNERDSIRDENRVNNDLLKKSRVKLKIELAKSGINKKMLDTFTNLFAALELYSLDTFEIYSLARAVEEFKKLGWDVNRILEIYQKGKTLESAVLELESKVKRIHIVLEDLYRKKSEEKRKWGHHYEIIEIFNNLVESGLTPEDIIKVLNALKNNFKHEALSQLLEHIEIYGNIAAARLKLEMDNPNGQPSNTFQ